MCLKEKASTRLRNLLLLPFSVLLTLYITSGGGLEETNQQLVSISTWQN